MKVFVSRRRLICLLGASPLLLLLLLSSRVAGFTILARQQTSQNASPTREITRGTRLSSSSNDEWKGEVVPGGNIRGCSFEQVEGSITEWTMTIDGEEADLGRFSEAIYKKIIGDAKQQRFQGFRPGTIPPHLEPTYRAFAMDECARETVLEAMQQNNIRPFDSARTDMEFENFCIAPPTKKERKKKSKGRKKQQITSSLPAKDAERQEDNQGRKHLRFATMKETIDAGWKPGQSFSFVAQKVKGQKLKDESEVSGSSPIDRNY